MLPIARIESAVDYITCTTTHGKETAIMITKAEKMAFREMESGNEVSGWKQSGYSGWKVGQVAFGTRDQEGMVQLSGATAGYDWFDIYQWAERVSRIDVQETYRVPFDVTRHVIAQFKRANRYSDKHNLHHVNDIWAGNDGGATAYLGSPKSEKRMRIYNKRVESKLDHYDGCVRYELQCRDDSARLVARRITDSASTQSMISGVLREFARGRGCRLPGHGDRGLTNLLSAPRRPSDCERVLEWLRVQVAPSIHVLFRHGLSDEFVASLALSVEETDSLVQSLKAIPPSTKERKKPCLSIASHSADAITNN